MLLGFYQKRESRLLHPLSVVCYLGVVVLLNVFSNLVRIFLLVHFAIMPGTVLHEGLGLLCLALYVALPVAVLVKSIVRRVGQHAPAAADTIDSGGKGAKVLLLLVLLGVAAYHVSREDTYEKFRHFSTKTLPGYTIMPSAPGILKVENQTTLIYIKYLRGFYDTDHNPMICWKGSGYELQHLAKQQWKGRDLYTAKLVNGTEELYTAWCYSNGRRYTTSQADWRLDLAKQESVYAVVNITTATQKELQTAVDAIFEKQVLSSLFLKP
jgi:exosortase N